MEVSHEQIEFELPLENIAASGVTADRPLSTVEEAAAAAARPSHMEDPEDEDVS